MQYRATRGLCPDDSVGRGRRGVLVAAMLLLSVPARADLILDETADANALANRVMSTVNGNVVINSVSMVGAAGQSATFTNGLSVPGFIDSDRGIVLSSGEVSSIAGPNAADGTSDRMPNVAGTNGDADFDALSTSTDGTFDAMYIVIDFTPQGDQVSGTFVFSSEEYNEYAPPDGADSVGNEFFDVMGFFVNGINYSTNADGSDVSINTVNKTLNASDYIDNDFGDFGGAAPFNIEADGFTRRLTWIAPVNPGVSNTLKFGVADGGDDRLNSWLLVDENSFRIFDDPADVDLALSVSDSSLEVVPGQEPVVETVVTNLGPASTGRDIIVDYTLPTGVTVNDGLASAVTEGGSNGDDWICVSDSATPQGVQCRSVISLGATPGNDASLFTFALDAIDPGLVGNILTLSASVSTGDTDSVAANDSATDSTDVVASDTLPPGIAFEGLPSITGSLDTIKATLRFDETVTGLSVGDIGVVNASVANFSIVDALTATFDLTPDGSGDIQVSLPAGSVQDTAGNDNTAAGPVVTIYDTDSPLLDIQNMPGVVADDSPFEVRFVFSEPVTGFTLTDVFVSNGYPGNLVMLDSMNWTASINPDTSGDVELSVFAGAAQALDDGVDSSGDSAIATFNASAPVVTLSGAPDVINSLDPWTMTLAFDEPVTGLEAGDIAVANATLGSLQTSGSASYTITVTPDGGGDVSFSLPEGSVDDVAAGNPNPPSAIALTRYDAVAPTASFSSLPAIVNSTSTYTVSLTFDEIVSGLDLADIGASNATLANLASSDDMLYTFEVTPDGSGNVVLSLAADVASDVASNGNDAATAVTTVYDDVPPSEPGVVPLTTNDTTPELNGSADLSAGNSLQVTVDGVDYVPGDGALENNGDNTWTLVIPAGNALTDAVLDVTVSLTDAAGNTSVESTSGELTIDTVPPSPPAVTPDLAEADDTGTDASDDLTNVAGARFTAPGGSFSPGTAVRLYANGVQIGAGLAAVDGNVLITAASLVEGTQSVTFTRLDAAGNESLLSAALDVTLDTAPPTPTFDAPIAVDGTVNAAESTALSLSGTSDPDSTVQVSIVDGTDVVVATATVNGAGVWSLSGLDVSAFADGPLLLDVLGTDAAGNSAAGSSALASLDTEGASAPVIVSQATSDTTPAIVITATLASGETLDVQLNGIVYSAPVGALVDDGSGGWVLNVASGDALVDGIYQVVATITDSAGNTTVDTSADDLVVDTVDPPAPAIDALISDSATPTISGDAVLVAGETLTVTLDGTVYSLGDGALAIAPDDRWTLEVPIANALADGTYDLVATIQDTAGNTSSDVTAPELSVDTTPPVAPTVDTLQTNDAKPSLSGTAILTDGETLSVKVDGETYVTSGGHLSIDGAGNWTLVIPAANPLAEGVYDVTVIVTDAAGNTGAETTSGELVVDRTPPPVPTLALSLDAASDSGSDDTDGVTQLSPVDLLVPAATLTTGDVLTLYIDGVAVSGASVVAAADGSALVSGVSLTEGAQSVTYVITDGAGNDSASSPTLEVTLDTLAPLPELASSIGGDGVINAFESTAFSLAGTSEPLSIVQIAIGDGRESVVATATTDASGEWRIDAIDLGAFEDGPIDIDVTGTDLAANVGASSTSTATLDTEGPVVPIVVAQTTGDTTPTLTFEAVIGSGERLDVLLDGITYSSTDGSLVGDGSGSWTLTVDASNALSDGVHDIVVTHTDSDGNVSTDLSVDELVIDSEAPVLTAALVSPTWDDTPYFEGTSDQPDGSTIDVVAAGDTLCTATVVAGAWACEATEVLADGTQAVSVISENGLGVVADVSITLLIDTAVDTDADGIGDLEEGADRQPPRDTDADGIPDHLDEDSDADGINDLVEGAGDSDGDRIPDYLDNDSDGDGVPDLSEQADDTDGDGVADYLDLDSDGDGISDAAEGNVDSDADGMPDSRDLDSDGDLIPDALERGSLAEGVLMTDAPLDSDGDGLADYIDSDSDNDGVLDLVEAAIDDSLAGVVPPRDSDADGLPDHLDPDSDNDGVPDVVEGAEDSDGDGVADLLDEDSNNDGLPDQLVGTGDVDGDGIPDRLDGDLDNDGISNAVEGIDDSDGDGIFDYLDPESDDDGIDDAIEGTIDSDGDGLGNWRDVDSDGDGIGDRVEGTEDKDGDGVANYIDLDSDGDGIRDAIEGALDADGDGVPNRLDSNSDDDGRDDATEGDQDSDGDGAADFVDPDNSDPDNVDDTTDTDGDGVPDVRDDDDDGDGISDASEGSDDTDGDGVADSLDTDSDDDGIDDALEGRGDADGDGLPDFRDTDSDGDGIDDAAEGVLDSDGDGTADFQDTDSDGDGLPDRLESTVDSDGDGIADYLDIDADGDGLADADESATDTDGDGLRDALDTDSDGDGIDDAIEGLRDTDGDGVPDYRDMDSDADGVADRIEGAADSDGDGTADYRDSDSDGDGLADSRESELDSDGDGLVDRIDTDSDGDGRSDASEGVVDTDGDGIENYLDLDSDNDTLADSLEGDLDTDRDGAPDALDLDADNDGLLDSFESEGSRSRSRGSNAAAPLDDEPVLRTSAHDRDGDGLPDYRDLDSDNDSITDTLEADGRDADSDGRTDDFSDADGNGWDDAVEASPLTPPDTDNDGLRDFRDADSDQDGLADIREVLGADVDGDGIVDDFQDSNGDGLDDSLSAVPAQLVDSDSDGLPDFREVDSDNDGRSDLVESGGIDIDGDGLADSLRDGDGDGIPDSVDVDVTLGSDADADGIDDTADSDFVAGPDRDLDGIVDARDPDADNDGFADDVGPGLSAALPDSDNNGVPDYQQPLPGTRVQTSVYGHGAGCSIVAPDTRAVRASRSRDPVFLLLVLAALVSVARRHSGPCKVLRGVLRGALQGVRLRGLHRHKALIGLSSVVALLGAGAVEAEPYQKRFYAGIGAGVSMLAPVTEETGLSLENDSAAAVHLHFGLDFHRRFSGELALGSLGTATLEPEGEIAYGVVGLSALAYHVFEPAGQADRLGLMGYLRAGIGALNTAASGLEIEQVNPVHVALGLGLEYGRPNGLAVRGELLSYDGDARAIQLALLWRFRQGEERREPLSSANTSPTAVPDPEADPAIVEEKPAAPPVVVPKAVRPKANRLIDSDRDGVEDSRDACPDSRSDRPMDARGCDLLDGVMAGVDFAPGTANLTVNARRVLDEVARAVVEFPSLTVRIDAHTDDALTPAEAIDLTRQQVKSVARHLLQRGVSREQLKARAFGSRLPLVENADSASRARNRRVEMRIMETP